MSPELNVVCVLRSGGIYTPEYVHRLRNALRIYLQIPHTFSVLSDLPERDFDLECTDQQTCGWKPLLQPLWKGWWSKLEIFRPRLTDNGLPILYFDLDTIIKGSLSPIVTFLLTQREVRRFWSLEDWLEPEHTINSSVMYWEGDLSAIHRAFEKDPLYLMQTFRKYPARWGDQGFIGEWLLINERPIGILQERFPGAFVSFKKSTERDREAATVVCFHGSPRPHERKWDWR